MTSAARFAPDSDVEDDDLPEPTLVVVPPQPAAKAARGTRGRQRGKAVSGLEKKQPEATSRPTGSIRVTITREMTQSEVAMAIDDARRGISQAEPTAMQGSAHARPRRGTKSTSELPAATTLRVRSRPKERQARTEESTFSPDELHARIIATPASYRLFDHCQLKGRCGAAHIYPRELYSVIWALQRWEMCSKTLRDGLGAPFSSKRRLLVEAVVRNLPPDTPDAERVAMRELLATRFPHRITSDRFLGKHADPVMANLILGAVGAETLAGWQARDGVSCDLSDPRPTQVIRGDGTALKGAASVHDEWNIDPVTHEAWKSPVDEAQIPHHEGGRPEAVFGTKMASIQAVGSRPGEFVCLGLEHVDSPNPQDEANVSVDLLQAFIRHHGDAVDVAGLAYDGALGAETHARVIDAGLLLFNRPPAHSWEQDPASGVASRVERQISHGEYKHKGIPDCPGHELVSIGGRYQVAEILNGRMIYEPVRHAPDRQITDGRTYLYEVLQVMCPGHGDQPIRIPWAGSSTIHPQPDTVKHRKLSKAAAEAETKAKAKVAEATRARRQLSWTRTFGCEAPTNTYRGWRNTIETFHSVLDASLPNGRMPAYSLNMKRIKMLGFALGHNLAAAHRLAIPDPTQAAIAAGIQAAEPPSKPGT